MRIFCAISLYNMEESLFIDTLMSMGHDVIHHGWNYDDTYTIDWNTGMKHDTNIAMIEKIKEEHAKEPIDLFFAYMSNRTTYPFIIKEITKIMKIPSVNFCWDDRRKVHMQSEIAKHFTLCWTTDKIVEYHGIDTDSVEAYKNMGATAIQLAAGASPDLFKPPKKAIKKKKYPISFIGSGGGGLIYRNNILDKLKERFGDELHFFGGITGNRITTEEYIDILHNSQIVLGFAGSQGADKICSNYMTVKGRDFEVPMCGAFYITEHNPDLEDLYLIAHLSDSDKEIETYNSIGGLVEKLDYYLKVPEECEEIAKRGMDRARKYHTMGNRFEEVFKELGLNA